MFLNTHCFCGHNIIHIDYQKKQNTKSDIFFFGKILFSFFKLPEYSVGGNGKSMSSVITLPLFSWARLKSNNAMCPKVSSNMYSGKTQLFRFFFLFAKTKNKIEKKMVLYFKKYENIKTFVFCFFLHKFIQNTPKNNVI